MGCFNQTAFISNISLTAGAPTVLIFLVRNKYNKNKPDVHAVYHTDNYEPLFLPIFGKYDDYGTIEDIERDANVEFIEDFFGLSIEEIISKVDNKLCGRHREEGEDDVPKNNEIFQTLTLTLEHRNVYNAIADRKRSMMWYKDSDINQYLLEDILGLSLADVKSTNERFNLVYKIPNCNKYELHSDGTWTQLYDVDKKCECSNFSELMIPNSDYIWGIYHPNQLISVLTHLSGIDYAKIVGEEQLGLTSYEHWYNVTKKFSEKESEEIETDPNDPKEIQIREETLAIMKDIYPSITDEQLILIRKAAKGYLSFNNEYKHEHFITSDRTEGRNQLIKLYDKANILLNDDLKQNLLDYLHFNQKLGINCISYKLSMYHNQETDWSFYQHLYQTCLDIANNEKKQYQEEDYDEID